MFRGIRDHGEENLLHSCVSVFTCFLLLPSSVCRYDASCTGEVDYNAFIEKVMESDFKGVTMSSYGQRLTNMVNSAFFPQAYSDGENRDGADDEEDSDMDEDEREMFRRTEVRRLFDIIDKDGSGYIDKNEVEELLKLLNRKSDKSTIDEGFAKLDTDKSGTLDFEKFYEWYKTVDKSKR